MRHAFTLFDYSFVSPRPLQSIVVDGENISFHTFWLRGTKLTIKQIRKNMLTFKKLFDEPICINDFKSHVQAFGLDKHVLYDVYDYCLPQSKIIPKDERHSKITLAKLANAVVGVKYQPWQKLYANASVVYQHLETRGTKDCVKKLPVTYSLDTFTGRSKTLGYNLQGTTSEDDIGPYWSDQSEYFIHFDWVSADLRMAAFLSNDKEMNDSFISSDPYTVLSECLGYTRPECKQKLIKALYSLSFDDPIFDLFRGFREWARQRLSFMRNNGYLDSIYGRRFVVNNNELTVFNSQFQGSVAHAMQALLVKTFPDFGAFQFTEIHDSIVFCCSEPMIKPLINGVLPIALDPLAGLVDVSPRMPVKISIGRNWKQWQHYKTFY